MCTSERERRETDSAREREREIDRNVRAPKHKQCVRVSNRLWQHADHRSHYTQEIPVLRTRFPVVPIRTHEANVFFLLLVISCLTDCSVTLHLLATYSLNTTGVYIHRPPICSSFIRFHIPQILFPNYPLTNRFEQCFLYSQFFLITGMCSCVEC